MSYNSTLIEWHKTRWKCDTGVNYSVSNNWFTFFSGSHLSWDDVNTIICVNISNLINWSSFGSFEWSFYRCFNRSLDWSVDWYISWSFYRSFDWCFNWS